MILRAPLFSQMLAHVQACYPEEACGILGGCREEALLVIPVENELHSPVRFRMKAEDQLRAMLRLEQEGLDLIAIWHSHPDGPERPSMTDLAEATYPNSLTLIWFRSGELNSWSLRAFHMNDGIVEEAVMLTGPDSDVLASRSVDQG